MGCTIKISRCTVIFTRFFRDVVPAELNLGFNMLNGTIPPIAASELKNLTDLYLNVNDITGSMPDSVCALFDQGSLLDLFADCNDEGPSGLPLISCECCTRCYT